MVIAVFGLKSVGKTTFCNYLSSKYSYNVIYLSKMLEKKFCNSVEGERKYVELKYYSESRIHIVNALFPEINQELKKNFVVIEGLQTTSDLLWFSKEFSIKCESVYIKNNDFELRLKRYQARNNYPINYAKRKLILSDIRQKDIEAKYNIERTNYTLNNSTGLENFKRQIDNLIYNLKKVYP